jgi:hypothetical protein
VIDLPPFGALALSLHHSPGVHAILVGSGLSRAAGIPTGWEITLDLIRRLAALDGVTERDDWAKWYRDRFSKEPNYSEILDALASTPAERRAILHSYIEPAGADDARKPTKAHHAIAQLVASGAVRVVVTTNFDRLIENALREAGIEPTVIASDDAIAGATPLVHATCTVIKVHGDYLDARIKNTDAELAGYSTAMNGLLDQVFNDFGLLVVGWSGEWDTALRSAILRAPSRRYPFFWAARGSVGLLAQDLIDQRGGRSFSITDADSFFVKLGETLEALKQASRPHPQSVEMAIAVAKRYCRDDKFAMEWSEFLHAEVEKVRRYVTCPDYPTVPPTKETLNGIIETFTIKTEVLRRTCLICGRWGTAEANRAVARAVQSLSFAAEPQGGYTWYIAMRELGASICFYWNLAGLIDRGDWQLARQLMHTEIKVDRANLPVASTLPPTAYDKVEWKFLRGREDRQTPISEYLFEKFKINARDISLRETRAEELFDEMELLISLEAARFRLKRMEGTGLWFWVPFGRFIWKDHGRHLDEAIKRLEGLSDGDPIYSAGLLGGTKAAAAPVFQAVRKFFGEMASIRWG